MSRGWSTVSLTSSSTGGRRPPLVDRECLDHLNLTAARFVPASTRPSPTRGAGPAQPRTVHLPAAGAVVHCGPRSRRRGCAAGRSRSSCRRRTFRRRTSARFMDWQEQIDERLRRPTASTCSGRSIVRRCFRCSSGAWERCSALTLAHERRHLWQAREVRNHPAFPAVSRIERTVTVAGLGWKCFGAERPYMETAACEAASSNEQRRKSE